MKKVLVTIALIGSIAFAHSQKKVILNGEKFSNGKGDSIIIQENHFTYIEGNDTLGQCLFSYLDNQFIELFLSSKFKLCNQPEITIIPDNEISLDEDSMKVVFQNKDKKDILLKILTPKRTPVVPLRDSIIVIIPKRHFDYLTFFLYPNVYKKRTDAKFYGHIHYFCIRSIGDSTNNCIRIAISSVNDKLFRENYLDGEYLMVLKNKIIWRGEEWYRIH